MKEHLTIATDYYSQVQKVVLDTLRYPPRTEEAMMQTASAIYAPMLKAKEEVDAIVTITNGLLGAEAARLKQLHEDAWNQARQLPGVRDRIKFVTRLGAMLEPLGSVVELLRAMEEKRFQHSNMRRY